MDFQKAIKILKKNGYSSSENISDYWFENNRELKKVLNNYNSTYSQTFELKVRWKSEIGQVCENSVRQHIKKIIDKSSKNFDYLTSKSRPVIDFSNFEFEFKNKMYSINDFVSKFKTSQLRGWADLRGIDLSNIRISDCIIKNCSFTNAIFHKASLQQIKLINCNFVKASFLNARLVNIKMDDNSTFGRANFTNAFLNALKLNDDNFGNIKFKKLSYIKLLWHLFDSIFHLNNKNEFQHNHDLKFTNFQLVETNNITAPENKHLKRYINWFMFVNRKLRNYRSLNFLLKLDVTINIILTKYWTSFRALIFNSVLITSIFSLIYYYNSDALIVNQAVNENIFTSIYFSFCTFSGFGYGDILPKTSILQLCVMIEIILGYFFLGIFIILITRKLETKY